MATDDDDVNTRADEQQRECIRGEEARKEEVADAPADAEVRSDGNLVAHRGGRRRRNDDLRFDDDDSWGSE